jgi:hypothetical protein
MRWYTAHGRHSLNRAKYQASLASGTGLPVDDTPRIELMAANLKVVEKIRTEIRALEHELDRQEGAEKSRS